MPWQAVSCPPTPFNVCESQGYRPITLPCSFAPVLVSHDVGHEGKRVLRPSLSSGSRPISQGTTQENERPQHQDPQFSLRGELVDPISSVVEGGELHPFFLTYQHGQVSHRQSRSHSQSPSNIASCAKTSRGMCTSRPSRAANTLLKTTCLSWDHLHRLLSPFIFLQSRRRYGSWRRLTLPPAAEGENFRLDQGVEWCTFEGKFDHLLNRKPWHDILDEQHAQGILFITRNNSRGTDHALIDRLMLAALLDVLARYHQTPRLAPYTDTELKKSRLCALLLEMDAEVARLRDQSASNMEQTVVTKIFDMASVYQDASVGELNSWVQCAGNAINKLKLKLTLPEWKVITRGSQHGGPKTTEEKKRKRSEEEMDVDEEPEQKKHMDAML